MPRPSPTTDPTRIAVSAAEPRARVDLAVGMLAPRVVQRGPGDVVVALSAAQMLLLDGDELLIEVEVGPGCTLQVDDVGGTVAYPGVSSWRLRAHVGERGALLWRGLPFVVASGARTRRATEVTLEAGATLLMRETVVLGRHGEVGGRVLSHLRIDQDGSPVLIEQLDGDAAEPRVGVLGTSRLIDAVVAAGYRPPSDSATLVFEAPGAMARHLGAEAHRSGLDDVWESWHASLTAQQETTKALADQGFRLVTPAGFEPALPP